MHSIRGNDYTTIHFNGDFSGDVVIIRHGTGSSDGEMRLPMQALDALFAERIRRTRIELLESMENHELINSVLKG